MGKENIEKFRDDNFYVLNSMDDWVRILDKYGRIVFINEKMKRDIHLDRSLIEQNIDTEKLNEKADIFKNTTIEEERLINDKYYSIKSSPLYYQDEFLGIIEVYRDITSESKMKVDLFNANRKMLEDIRFVRKIQSNILPKNKVYGDIKLEGRYLPSNDVSGDLFDIIKIDKDKYSFYIADVMGHGVKSSIMTMFVKLSIAAIFERHPFYSPGQVLKKLREEFVKLDMNSSQYFTVWIGIFDCKNNTLTFSNAGHNCPPLHLINKKSYVEKLVVSGRMISNIIEQNIYQEVTINLNPKDKILFYTDGIIESKDIGKNEYSVERLMKILNEDRGLDYILGDLEKFTWGEQDDDISLAIIDYKGEKNEN
ncbi:stage II sporulation protein E [Anaerococcus hydrogenalis DSM 7454]|uniref:Stage II sporulation protein E n=1 Tax=Anaerococcus hydrogenalis DSM 7454 TaxID=561177 RepID=B6WB69_9FIRM|nr:PP2C family protein-serine/threonine phosphatase [Anaerococcus hydrogenalis]EEB35338.1 stage II sporulation protein E [Anaerococcus hydrogenalis DSM 7454]